MAHGTMKWLNFPSSSMNVTLTSPPGAAGIIELVGGALLVLGLFTRPVAFICSGTMAAAYFMGHVAPNPANVLLPILNHGELAILYCWMFLLIAVRGAGKWSVDAARGADA
jgi:putative oxidoreductase